MALAIVLCVVAALMSAAIYERWHHSCDASAVRFARDPPMVSRDDDEWGTRLWLRLPGEAMTVDPRIQDWTARIDGKVKTEVIRMHHHKAAWDRVSAMLADNPDLPDSY